MDPQTQATEHADAETLAKISEAQTLNGRPRTDYMVAYKNIGELLEQQAAASPNKVYLVYCEDEQRLRLEYTYQQFNARVDRIANLLAGLGLKRGDAVGTMMYNHADTVQLYFAAWKLGAVVVPVNAEEDDARIAFTFTNAECKAVFVRPELADRLAGFRTSLGQVRHVVQVGGAEWEQTLAAQAAGFRPAEPVTLDDDALIVYTSGTTGNPKGVVLAHYNLLVDPESIARWHKIDAEHTLMCVLPIHHVNGIVVTLITPLYVGGRTVLNRRPYIGSFWRRLAEEQVQIVSVVPTLLQFLCEKGDDLSKYDLSGFRHFICGAGTLSIALATRFEDQFKQRIMHGYGLSETTCYDCFLPVDLGEDEHRIWLQQYGYPSIGVAIDCNQMAIHDPDGNALAEDARGEIVIRGHLVTKYYFKRPDANRETFKHGWFRSGDEGFFKTDDKGRAYFFITGRLKELIIRGGVNLSPFEIEEAINVMPGVKTALAIAFDNKWYGEEVGAYVQREPGSSLTEEQVIAFCRQHLLYSKTPKVVLFGDDIPVTSTGKFQRMKLKPLFKQWEETQFREES